MVKQRTAILISGRGSNMAALMDAARASDYPAEIVLVIANKPDAPGLEVARARGIAAQVVDHKSFETRELFDKMVDLRLRASGVDVVCLAGFLRIFTAAFIEGWLGRMINIHPALLPAFKGLNTHQKALDAGVAIAGCTVHFTVPELDSGPIIGQAAVPVRAHDTAGALAARVLKAEHALFPLCLRMLCEGRVRLEGARAVFDGADPPALWVE